MRLQATVRACRDLQCACLKLMVACSNVRLARFSNCLGCNHHTLAAGPRDTQASAEMCMRMVHAAGLPCGSYIFHYAASEATLYGETHGELPSVTAVHMPVLLLTSQALLVLSGGGTWVATSISLAGIALDLMQSRRQHVTSGTLKKAAQVGP